MVKGKCDECGRKFGILYKKYKTKDDKVLCWKCNDKFNADIIKNITEPKNNNTSNIVEENISRNKTNQILSDKLYIGMPFNDIVNLLGEPSGINPGTEMIEGPQTVVASNNFVSRLERTKYCMWKRSEGVYLLVIEDDKIARITSTP